MGVWIEIDRRIRQMAEEGVTPFVGVWIEIDALKKHVDKEESLPSWECGLKSSICWEGRWY